MTQEISYVGELLWPGILGRLMIIVSVLTGLFAAFYYYWSAIASPNHSRLNLRIAQWLYIIQTIAMLAAGVLLYYLIFNHRFEYNYVWKYSSMSLQPKYIFACFWAGQEGSFWVWAFWQGLVGLVIAFGIKQWKAHLMAVVSISQFFLLSMLLGIEILGLKIGSSPFVLLRQLPEYAGNPFFANPDYVSMIADGMGLNPLLENPWMVTHPPVLFLGYALFLVPYAYAVTALWKNDFTGWIKPALPWVSLSLLVLGAGIMLGGRWAYESLTFGGFWAWDPVENASLVPWLILVAALHLMLLNLRRKQHFRTSLIFSILGFLFVLYATFLTRSGILAETSVHSFSADKRFQQIMVFMAVFGLLPAVAMIRRWKSIPATESEELFSREFFMFAGSIVLILSSFQIIFATSIPVINAVLGTSLAPPSDPVAYFNTWQLPFALMMLLLIGMAQFQRYGRNNSKEYFRNLLFSIIVTILLTIIYEVIFHSRFALTLLVAISIFSVITALDYMLRFVQKPQNLPGSLTHLGFGLFMAAIVLTFANEQTISFDPITGSDNIKMVRGNVYKMGDYHVVYSGYQRRGNENFYKVDFLRADNDSTFSLDFTLTPSINRHPQMGQVSNPATKHKLSKDIYTYVLFAQTLEDTVAGGFSPIEHVQMKQGDTIISLRSFIIFDSLAVDMNGHDEKSASIHARFTVKSMMAPPQQVWASYHVSGDSVYYTDGMLQHPEAVLRFEGVSAEARTIDLGIYVKAEDHIVMRVIIFPYIKSLWLGSFIMFVGLLWAVIRRLRANTNRVSIQ